MIMDSIRVLIVDDERYAREELRYLLEAYQQLNIIGETDSGEKAVIEAIQLKPDVVFLDIEMPKMNGIDVAKSLHELKKVPLIVFATAFAEFAVEAFRVNAIDYLMKPYNEKDIEQTVCRIQKTLLPTTTDTALSGLGKLAVEFEGELDYLVTDKILYIYPEGKQSKIITKKNEYIIKSSLKELEQRLTSYSFFRIHRSYLVNLNYVTRLTPWFNGAYHVDLEGVKKQLPVSRNYVKDLRERLEL